MPQKIRYLGAHCEAPSGQCKLLLSQSEHQRQKKTLHSFAYLISYLWVLTGKEAEAGYTEPASAPPPYEDAGFQNGAAYPPQLPPQQQSQYGAQNPGYAAQPGYPPQQQGGYAPYPPQQAAPVGYVGGYPPPQQPAGYGYGGSATAAASVTGW